jgi:ABC-type bacteriocin/lantibiotic exporter with double-glycine peptidase domain
MLVASRRFARIFERHLEAWHDTARAFSIHTQLLLNGIATIRAAGTEDHEVERFEGEIEGFIQAGYTSAVAGSRPAALQGAVATVAGVAVLIAGGILVAGHSMRLGSLIAFYAVVALILRQVSTAPPNSVCDGAEVSVRGGLDR